VLFKVGDALAGSVANPFYVKLGFTDNEIAWSARHSGRFSHWSAWPPAGCWWPASDCCQACWSRIVQMFSNLMFAWQAQIGHDVAYLMVTIGLENFSSRRRLRRLRCLTVGLVQHELHGDAVCAADFPGFHRPDRAVGTGRQSGGTAGLGQLLRPVDDRGHSGLTAVCCG